MKKQRLFITLLIAIFLCFTLAASASAESKTVVLKIGSPYMTVNGKQLEIDPGRGTKPQIISGRTVVPIRTIVNQMGGTIAWDGKPREIVMSANNKTISMTLNKNKSNVKLNSAAKWTVKTLEVAPQSINGRTMVPLRFVSEELGATVKWDGKAKTITITFNAVKFDPAKWTGAWETNEGIIVLTQTGNKVVTTFETDVMGKITGTDSSRSFKGRWYIDEVEQGDISITLSKDGKTFKGRYCVNSTAYPFEADPKNPDAGWYTITGQRSW